MSKHVFIFGSSNSILDGGYVTYLAKLIPERDLPIKNYSIGDQTSVTGFMQLMEHINELEPGSAVIWEYSLLDAILTDSFLDPDLVFLAALCAWREIIRRSSRLILVEIEPKDYIGKGHVLLAKLRRAAAIMKIPYIISSAILNQRGCLYCEYYYSDDRHLIEHSDAVSWLASAIADELARYYDGDKAVVEYRFEYSRPALRDRLLWRGAKQLGATLADGKVLTFKNRFVTIDALNLDWPNKIEISRLERLVAVGIISSCDSGALWCGHIGCPPVSCRLPLAHSRFSFLVRSTRVPCIRIAGQSSLTSMPDWLPADHAWADYGQLRKTEAGQTFITGILTIPSRP